MLSSPSLSAQAAFAPFDPLDALQLIRREADWLGIRFSAETRHRRSVRNGRPEQNSVSIERGVMIEAMVDGQLAYAATSDLSREGLLAAAARASRSARISAHARTFDFDPVKLRPAATGHYRTSANSSLDSASLAEFTDRLIEASHRLKVSDKIVTASAEASFIESEMRYVSTHGGDISQQFLMTGQNFVAIAHHQGETQQRTFNGQTARCWQGGLESFNWDAIHSECERVGEEALQLLDAENCPDATLDLVLAPDQMLLQIHESIGHPLELDRILGDERNYAGWSFIKPDDFGTLQYGSSLMNVSFDPGFAGEFASYGFDDGGTPATQEFLIKEGRLLRGLGGLESQTRLGLPGVSNFRACSWNRAPIDRMANINLHPGDSSLEDMISGVERGVFMQANRSWSIDDYRNKFQFGCEYGRLIENGKLTRILKNPNYRGITIPFWHSLSAVGNAATLEAFGTPYCGKGEPNQIIRVGHASPPCLFRSVQVFGADA